MVRRDSSGRTSFQKGPEFKPWNLSPEIDPMLPAGYYPKTPVRTILPDVKMPAGGKS
jgi:hypothetical protein